MRLALILCSVVVASAAMAQPQIEVTPADSLLDEPVSIVVKGLPPSARVSVVLRGWGDSPQWSSSASFIADANGLVDLTRMQPAGGDYSGVDAMGLFWAAHRGSSAVASVERELDASRPPPEVWRVSAEVNGKVAASASLVRRAVASDVTMSVVRERGLAGVFYQPPGGGRHPAVVVLSGSGGGVVPATSFPGGLASRGYAVLALAYFGVEGLPPSLHNIPVEYFGTALEWLSAQPSVDPHRIGVLGISRGGELALLLAAIYSQTFRTVIAYVPSNMVVGGCCTGRNEASWTIGGRPFVWSFPGRGNFLADQRAAIPVEQIRGAVLLISGRSDRVWPSTEMSNAAMARLDRSHFAYPHEHLAYADAGHGIGRPYTSTADVGHVVRPLPGRMLALGGTPAGTARAREDSWIHVLAFLEKNLRDLP